MSLPLLGAGSARVGGGGGGYGLTGLIGWWDASVTASLTLSGSNISSAADQSGTGNDLTSSGTGGSPPTYNATGFNSSHPTMTFSSAGTYLVKSGFAFGTGNTLTVAFVGQFTSSSSSYGRIASYFSTGKRSA
jgi:hypothetical protein